MASFAQVKAGVIRYLETELVSQLTGWRRWVVGAYLGMAAENAAGIFENVKRLPAVEALKIVDQDDDIDVGKLYKAFSKEAEKGAVTFNAPVLGNVTLKSADIDKLYGYIRDEAENA